MKKRKYFLVIALLFTGMTSTWAYEGEGTATTPYLINTVDDLKQLAQDVNGGTNYAGKNFELTTDLDLKNAEWESIGNDAKPFSGIFDGKGHVISNFKVNGTEHGKGLFGGLTIGKIMNLGVRNGNVTNTQQNTGVLVGVVKANGTVEDCYVLDSSVEFSADKGQCGILIGRTFNVSINNCFVVNSKLIVPKTATGDGIGALVGSLNSKVTMKNCYVKGITFEIAEGKTPKEGIFAGATNTNGDLTFENCYAEKTGNYQFVNAFNAKQIYKQGADTLTITALSDLNDKLYLDAVAFTDETVVTALNNHKINNVEWKQGSGYPIFSTMNDPITHITSESMASEKGFQIISLASGIKIITNEAQIVNLYGIDGRLVKVVELTEGDNIIHGLVRGIYILNNQKVVVK